MPSTAALAARDARILAGYRAGPTIPDLALAEEVDPQVIHRVLQAAGITPDDESGRGITPCASDRSRLLRRAGLGGEKRVYGFGPNRSG